MLNPRAREFVAGKLSRSDTMGDHGMGGPVIIMLDWTVHCTGSLAT